MGLLAHRPINSRQPVNIPDIRDEFRGICGPILLPTLGAGVTGAQITTVGAVGRDGTAGGLAYSHSASGINIVRAAIPNSTLGTTAVGGSLLVVFRTTTSGTDLRIASMGSDQGSSGNTLFSVETGATSAANLKISCGGSDENFGWESANVNLNSGAIHCCVLTVTNFSGSAALLYGVAFDGKTLVPHGTSTGIIGGTSSTYNYVVSGGFRRGGTDSAGADCKVLMVIPFMKPLTDAMAKNLSTRPWQIFNSPLRIIPVQEASGTPQYLAPVSDVAAGSWLPSTGSDLYAMLDETSYSDTDYIYTTSATTATLGIASGGDPAVSTGHTLRYRLLSGSGKIAVTLKQSSTTIASWGPHTLTGAAQDFAQTLTAGEADSITDYSALRVEFTSSLT